MGAASARYLILAKTSARLGRDDPRWLAQHLGG